MGIHQIAEIIKGEVFECSTLFSMKFNKALPKAGMLKNGKIYQTSEPYTAGQESGLWPTPDCQNHRDGTKLRKAAKGKHAVSLHHAVMWPTPDCSDRRSMKSKQQGLSNAVKLFPTPAAMDANRGPLSEKRYQKKMGGPNLISEVKHRMLPTPSICGNHNRKGASKTSGDGLATVIGGSLNPTWVSVLMGYPTYWMEVNDGKTEEIRAEKELQILWKSIRKKSIQEKIGRLGSIQEEGVLQQNVHGKRLCQRCSIVLGVINTSREIPWEILRNLWGYSLGGSSSHRWKSLQQLYREYPDLVCQMSHYSSPPCKACWSDGSWEDGISRVAIGIKERVNRLKCLGNAVVPQCVALVGKMILKSGLLK